MVQAQVTLRVSGGLSRARADITDPTAVGIPTNALNGLVVGLVAGYQLTPHLGLQIGARYAEGGTGVTPPGSNEIDMEFGVSFLEVPLFLKMRAGGAVSPYLLAGGVMGIRTDAELKANGGPPPARCDKAFAELIDIYHAQNAEPHARPPLLHKKPNPKAEDKLR